MTGVEVASGYVSLYAKFANGFSSQIRTELSKASKAAGLGGSSDPFTKASEESGKKSGEKFGAGFSTAAKTVLTGAAITTVVKFLGDAKEAYSELEDATAAAGVVFGDSMDQIISKSETAATTLGMSKAQVIDAANTFGTLGKSANLSGDDLADFSNRMTDVAGSLSSFKGGSPEEAIMAVGAALRGESEPIRRYGILLDDATLRQQALKLGLIETTKNALTPQQRVLAAQAAILAQSTDAMGDFARTADSTANVQKTLAAESANLSAEIGEKVAPMFVAGQRAASQFLGVVSDNLEVLVPLAGAMGTVTAAVGGFVLAAKGVEALKAAKATLVGLGDAFQQMGTKAKIATASAGAIGIALAGAALVYGVFAQENANAQGRVEDFTSALQASNGALDENVQLTARKMLQDAGALTAAQQLGLNLDTVTNAALGNAEAMQIVNERLAEADEKWTGAGSAATDEAKATGTLRTALGQTSTALEEAKVKHDQLYGATKDTTSATKSSTDATNGNTDATNANVTAQDKLYAARLKLRGDRRSFQAAIDDATEALKKNGQTLDIHTEKGRANQAALDGIAQSGLDYVQSLKDQKRPQSEVDAALRDSRVSFVRAATAMGMGRDEAVRLANKLGLVKNAAERSKDKLAELAAKAKKLDGHNIKFSVSAAMNKAADEIVYSVAGHGSVKFSAKALGGWAPPGLVLRGENGPEFTYESRPTYTYTATQTKDMLTAAPAAAAIDYRAMGTALADVLQARGATWLLVNDRLTRVRTLAEEMA